MIVPGAGPKPCKYMFVGECPGKVEDQKGIPFVGPAGQEFDRYLWRSAGLNRADVYVTNLVKERPDKDKVTVELVKKWEQDLWDELMQVNPEVIVTLGAWSTKWFLGNNASMDRDHSIPRRWGFAKEGQASPIVFPIVHPAAGLHSPEAQPKIAYGFEQLGAFIRGGIATRDALQQKPPVCIAVLDQAVNLQMEGLRKYSHLHEIVAVDTEGFADRPWGLSFSLTPTQAWVIKATQRKSIEAFGEWMKGKLVILHNSLHDLPVLQALGIDISTLTFTDTMIMAYLLQVEPQGLKDLAWRFLGLEMRSYDELVAPYGMELYGKYLMKVLARLTQASEIKQGRKRTLKQRVVKILKDTEKKRDTDMRKRWLAIDEDLRRPAEVELGTMPEGSIFDVPDSEAIPYAGMDAAATLGIYESLLARVKAMGLEKCLKMDLGNVPMVNRQQQVGMGVNLEHFHKLGNQLTFEMWLKEMEVHQIAGRAVNPGSGDQVADLLFHQLGIPSLKMTKGKKREATDDKVLQAIRSKHPVVEHIIDFREAQKLHGTYATEVPKFARNGDNGYRIYPTRRITRVVTGRQSASDPNVLAMPVRTELGKQIRHGFVAGEGRLLGSWDLDQIEMRVQADESGDANLIAVLSDSHRHIHKETTAKIYGIKVEDVRKDSTEYMLSKNVSFGIIYQITAHGLLDQVRQRGQDWTEEDCQKMIDEWYKVYPGVKTYQEERKAEARRYGFVRDRFGRIRYLPGVHSPIARIREEALRQAANSPIQSGAAGILKIAENRMWQEVWPEVYRLGVWFEPLLSVHDELLCEGEEWFMGIVDPKIRETMETSVEMKVPIRVSSTMGRTWGELK